MAEERGGQRTGVGDTLAIISGAKGIGKLSDLSPLLKPSRKCSESEGHFSISQLRMELLNMVFSLTANFMVGPDFMEV